MLFIGVCRLLGGLLSVASGMYRYAFYRCVSDKRVCNGEGKRMGSRVKDDLSLGVDTVLCAMVLTIANRSRSKSLT